MVGSLVNGVGGLIVLVVITLIIIATILGANLIPDTAKTLGLSTTNETATWLNATAFPLATSNSSNSAWVFTEAWNSTDNTPIGVDHIVVSATGEITAKNATVWDGDDSIIISYTYTHSYDKDNGMDASDRMKDNFTAGIDNVSAKLPTIFLIAAVVLLFGVLVALVAQSRRIGIGSGGGSL